MARCGIELGNKRDSDSWYNKDESTEEGHNSGGEFANEWSL